LRSEARVGGDVIGTFIDAVTWDSAVRIISGWASNAESRYVCICNAHSVVTGTLDSLFRRVLDESDLSTPDGAPVAWFLRRTGYPDQERINGPDLMWKYCEVAASRGEPIFLYGGAQETLEMLVVRLRAEFPSLRIAGAYSPPFRALSESEDEEIVSLINASGAKTVWVSLGCPKQEIWMANHRGRIKAVMIGVGAAFDYHAGTIKRAPLWFQRNGLEWLHRLSSEPRRLWRRYLVTNSIFLVKAIRQLIFK